MPIRLVAIASILLPVAALAAEPRQGAAAFGGWRGDAPGVERRIRPQDLPPPFATDAHATQPDIVPRPSGAMPRVPDGFVVELVADGLEGPRTLRAAPDGDLFVVESRAGRIRVLPADGGQPVLFARGLNRPYGLAFYPPGPDPKFVYVAERNRVVRFPYEAGARRAGGAPEIVVKRLPDGGSHWTRDLAFSNDGRQMFIAVGSASNIGSGMGRKDAAEIAAWEARHGKGAAWGNEAGRAAVFVATPEGANLRTFATGLRNCSGLAVAPGSNDPWCAVNERDGLGDDLPPDFVTRVADGAFYGWPWFYIGANPDPRQGGARADLSGSVTVPDVLLQPHSAPLGMAFYDHDAFPAEYRGDAFVALHGSWNRDSPTGYKVVRLPMRDGRPTGGYEDFMTGFVLSDEALWGRPVGVAVGRDGALYVSEDANGTVWRVRASK
ncbi:PQQ-dependent sugar dehydrogenase [Kaistia adipata]|uniref:PQQ-dependent sugar dehydrogenase n=1 Tax=Kaistia adipata TaxID=166954 RepID=UPI000423FFDB|nr:PQQ-dependent sugar dehydrogenase [Kaistia adipata]